MTRQFKSIEHAAASDVKRFLNTDNVDFVKVSFKGDPWPQRQGFMFKKAGSKVDCYDVDLKTLKVTGHYDGYFSNVKKIKGFFEDLNAESIRVEVGRNE